LCKTETGYDEEIQRLQREIAEIQQLVNRITDIFRIEHGKNIYEAAEELAPIINNINLQQIDMREIDGIRIKLDVIEREVKEKREREQREREERERKIRAQTSITQKAENWLFGKKTGGRKSKNPRNLKKRKTQIHRKRTQRRR
jgi:hypothetical protein